MSYRQAVTREDERNLTVLHDLRTSGLVQLVLNPSIYTMKVNQEQTLHATNLQHLADVLQQALLAYHCKT